MGICKAKGFKAASTKAGIKYKDRLDMAAIISEAPCTYAAVFTKNVVKAAPVIWDKKILDGGKPVRAVVVNTGIANAATALPGLDNCKETAEYAEKAFGLSEGEVLLGSTGVIGPLLPMDRIKAGIDALKSCFERSDEAATLAANAIMTTDTHKKEACTKIKLSDTNVSIGGMVKGSGMIHPNMGTMLCYITTDAAINKELLQKALKEVVDVTFNMVSVDGDTSTNDTCMVLANGMAGNKLIETEGSDYEAFKEGLLSVCKSLAIMVAEDGEGATALITAKTVGVKNKEDARTLAKSIITSSLTKAAIFGHDANWGRIMCAMGYSGAEFDPYKTDIYVASDEEKLMLVKDGLALSYSEEDAGRILSNKSVTIICDLKEGEFEATAWGCDLSFDYVKINADYRS